jgi:hypothetical protein
MSGNTQETPDLEELIDRARSWFPDANPSQLKRAVEQSFALNQYDDHGLIAFAMVCSMLKIGVAVEDVVQVLALTKINLMGQQHQDGGMHPDAPSP